MSESVDIGMAVEELDAGYIEMCELVTRVDEFDELVWAFEFDIDESEGSELLAKGLEDRHLIRGKPWYFKVTNGEGIDGRKTGYHSP